MEKLREFTKLDWYGWQGADEFKDGSSPLIAEGKEGTMIVCGSEIGDESAVISVYFGEDLNSWGFKSYNNKECALEDAEFLVDLLDTEFDESRWSELGFEVVS